jgi:hypothetical protein
MNLFPLPNVAGTANNFTGLQSTYTLVDNIVGRADQLIGDRQRFSFKATHIESESIVIGPLGQIDSPNQDLLLPSRSYSASYNMTVTPSLVYSAAAGYTLFHRENYEGNSQGAGLFGYSVNPAPSAGNALDIRPQATFDIYRSLGTGTPQDQVEETIQFNQSISKVTGKHVLKAGMDLRRYRDAGLVAAGVPNGTFAFSALQTSLGTTSTGNSAASLLLGLPNTTLFQLEPDISAINFADAFFLSDDFRIARNLTVNLGLRYEFETPLTEQHNRAGWFDANTVNSVVNLPGVFQYAGLNGNPRQFTEGSWNHFAPRVGFAYTPGFGGGKTVIRGAAGVYYSPIPGAGFYGPGPGFDTTYNPTKPNATAPSTPLVTAYTLPPENGPQGAAANLGLSITQPLNRQAFSPQTYQWNIGVQRELMRNVVLEVMYAGNRGVHLLDDTNIDLPAQSVINSAIGAEQASGKSGTASTYLSQAVVNPLSGLVPGTLGSATVSMSNRSLRFPQYTAVTVLTNGRDSEYNSLQTKLEKRLSSGLTLLVAYTYSKLIDDIGESNYNSSETPNIGSWQDPYNLRDARAVSSFDRTNNFTSSFVYALPAGRAKRFLNSGWPNAIAGGFSISGILTAQSGAPMAITQNANGLGLTGSRPDEVASASVNQAVQGKVNANGSVQWLNPAQFVQVDGRYGSAPIRQSDVRGPDLWRLDLGIQRDFRIMEGVKLGFRAQAFNALNHTKLDLPTQNLASPAYGQIVAVYTPRVFQFSLKLQY